MKTHELAKALTHLSRILRAGPNVDLSNLVNLEMHVEAKSKKNRSDEIDRGAALALLSEMSNYSKKELIELANSLNIPLEVRPADAVRDVLGKILKYINENPTVKDRLVHSTTLPDTGRISPIAKALAILMNQS